MGKERSEFSVLTNNQRPSPVAARRSGAAGHPERGAALRGVAENTASVTLPLSGGAPGRWHSEASEWRRKTRTAALGKLSPDNVVFLEDANRIRGGGQFHEETFFQHLGHNRSRGRAFTSAARAQESQKRKSS